MTKKSVPKVLNFRDANNSNEGFYLELNVQLSIENATQLTKV